MCSPNNYYNQLVPQPPLFPEIKNCSKICTGDILGGLTISVKGSDRIVFANNNRAKYFADLAEKHKEEAKAYRDNAKFYAEQNSDITLEYIDGVKNELKTLIQTKQDTGDYALKSELPKNISELENDALYANKSELESAVSLAVPTQVGQEGKFLCSNGEITYWEALNGFSLFDTKISDHVLTGIESIGWILNGSLVSNTYQDAFEKINELYQNGTETVYKNISCRKSVDSRYIADILQKDAIDSLIRTEGSSEFYILDSQNNCFYLPTTEEKMLYYCVGASVINESLIDISNVLNDLQNKVDKNMSNSSVPYLKEVYQNGTSWYRVWSDGWCEQGGHCYNESPGTTELTISFLKEFANLNYCATRQPAGVDLNTSSGTSMGYLQLYGFTTNYMMARVSNHIGSKDFMWTVCGYLAEGEY